MTNKAFYFKTLLKIEGLIEYERMYRLLATCRMCLQSIFV